jgi:predicted phosphodiesterase
VSGKAVTEKTRAFRREQRELARQIKAKEKAQKAENDPKKVEKLADEIGKLQRSQGKISESILALTPERMADELAKCLPRFTDAKGKPVKLYIIPSPAYDKADGEKTAQLLAERRERGELRLLKSGGDRLPLWEDTPQLRMLEVLTPDKQAWLRGDNHSAPVQRRIKDKRRQTSSGVRVDLQIVGGVGVSILKPEGHWPIGFVAVPALHRLDETGVAENQIGVQVVEIECDRRNATMRSYSFKDLISRERTFIGVPSEPTASETKCIDALRKSAPLTTGSLAEKTDLSKEAVHKTLKPHLATKDHKRYKTWPGLVYDDASDRWDFNLAWVQQNLRYRYPEGTRKTDKVVAICCMHAGSRDTDYGHFLTEVPRVMLERDVRVLVSAGDHVEGTKHDILMKGEIIGGFGNSEQEELAARMIAQVMFTVFKARFDQAVKAAAPKSAEAVSRLVDATLPEFLYVFGNHCAWVAVMAIEPLITMIHEIVKVLTHWIGEYVASKSLRVDGLMELVERHIQTKDEGRFTMPSGLAMGMTHPHMGGSETISSSSQKALMMYRDCPVVFIGNFHTGVVVEEWEGALGQRVCVQIGTMKHGSPFEKGHMKTVDQGFAFARFDSIDGRIVCTETTFYSNDKAKPTEKRYDRRKTFNAFLDEMKIRR